MFADLRQGIVELFEEAQSRSIHTVEFGMFEDNWLARSVAEKTEYHREMDLLRAARPRLIITPVAPYSHWRSQWYARTDVRVWSEAEDKKLMCWYVQGKLDDDMARRLGRTVAAVQGRTSFLAAGKGLDAVEIKNRRAEERKRRGHA